MPFFLTNLRIRGFDSLLSRYAPTSFDTHRAVSKRRMSLPKNVPYKNLSDRLSLFFCFFIYLRRKRAAIITAASTTPIATSIRISLIPGFFIWNLVKNSIPARLIVAK